MSHIAVLVSFVLLQVLGFVWYSESLFGAQWIEAVGLSLDDMAAPPNYVWAIMIVSTLVKVYLLAYLLRALGANTLGGGLVWGGGIGLGLLAMTLASHHGFALRPLAQIWIEGSQEVIGAALAGAVIGAWPKRD